MTDNQTFNARGGMPIYEADRRSDVAGAMQLLQSKFPGAQLVRKAIYLVYQDPGEGRNKYIVLLEHDGGKSGGYTHFNAVTGRIGHTRIWQTPVDDLAEYKRKKTTRRKEPYAVFNAESFSRFCNNKPCSCPSCSSRTQCDFCIITEVQGLDRDWRDNPEYKAEGPTDDELETWSERQDDGSMKVTIDEDGHFGAVFFGAEQELKRKSCCCGATKSHPCVCMIQGVMKCSATCPCSLAKKGDGPRPIRKTSEHDYVVGQRKTRWFDYADLVEAKKRMDILADGYGFKHTWNLVLQYPDETTMPRRWAVFTDAQDAESLDAESFASPSITGVPSAGTGSPGQMCEVCNESDDLPYDSDHFKECRRCGKSVCHECWDTDIESDEHYYEICGECWLVLDNMARYDAELDEQQMDFINCDECNLVGGHICERHSDDDDDDEGPIITWDDHLGWQYDAESFAAEEKDRFAWKRTLREKHDKLPYDATWEETLIVEIMRLRGRLEQRGFDPHAKIGDEKYAESFAALEGQRIPNLTMEEWDGVSKALGEAGTFHNRIHEGTDGEGGDGTTLVVNKRHGIFGRRNTYVCDSCDNEYSPSQFPDGFRKHQPESFCEYCLDKLDYPEDYDAESFSAEATTEDVIIRCGQCSGRLRMGIFSHLLPLQTAGSRRNEFYVLPCQPCSQKSMNEIRRQQGWSGAESYCPNHDETYAEGSFCPFCEVERRNKEDSLYGNAESFGVESFDAEADDSICPSCKEQVMSYSDFCMDCYDCLDCCGCGYCDNCESIIVADKIKEGVCPSCDKAFDSELYLSADGMDFAEATKTGYGIGAGLTLWSLTLGVGAVLLGGAIAMVLDNKE